MSYTNASPADWSPALVESRRTEITSLLGNLLSRSTSKAILARVDLTRRLVYGEDPSLDGRPLVALLKALPAEMDAAMSELRVSDALTHIRAALTAVRTSLSHPPSCALTTPHRQTSS